MINTKYLTAFVLVVLVMVAGFTWWKVRLRTTPPVGELFQITMASYPGYYHSFIAQEQGFFRDEGVNAELTLREDVPANLQAFVEGKADAAFGLQSDAILLASQGVPLKIVYVVDFSNGADVVLSKPNIKTVADLVAKTVSVDKLYGFNHIFLAELLRDNGIAEEDVHVVPVVGSEVPIALRQGTIDAGQTWEPYKSKGLAEGNRLLATSADAPGIITDVLMVHTEVIEQREQEVRGVVKALLKALTFRRDNESLSYAIMSEATGVPAGSLRDSIEEGNIFPNLRENRQAFIDSPNPTSLYTSGKFICDFFVKHGIVEIPVNLENIHAPGILAELNTLELR